MKRTERKELKFNSIDWKLCIKQIKSLQEKLVVAFNKGEMEDVRMYQNKITSSFWGRALAVKTVVRNKGGKIPGRDGEIWETEEKRTQAIFRIKIKGYKTQPLKEIEIPRANGKMGPLSIPCMQDRAMQALYALALDPIAEATSDERSYGFRKFRSTEDAKEYLHQILSNRNKPRFILKGEIKGFLEKENIDWILKNIPLDKRILKQWLKAGLLKGREEYETELGVPQGGRIFPIIANMVLNGLEQVTKDSVKDIKLKKNKSTNYKVLNRPKVNIVRFANDFIITASTREILEEKVIPAVNAFLRQRGIYFNLGKTAISRIEDGFDFLGFNFRKYSNLLKNSKEIFLIKPSEKSKKFLIAKITKIFKALKGKENFSIIQKLNPPPTPLRGVGGKGWANYFRKSNASKTFKNIKNRVWIKIWRFLLKRDGKLGKKEVMKRNFSSGGEGKYPILDPRGKGKFWVFTGETGESKRDLFDISSTKILRHILCLNKNPYLKSNEEYFSKRILLGIDLSFQDFKIKLLKKSKGLCLVCEEPLQPEEEIELHHIIPKAQGGPETLKNLLFLHKICHANVTFNRNPKLHARYIKLGIISNDTRLKGKKPKKS